MAHFLKRWCW